MDSLTKTIFKYQLNAKKSLGQHFILDPSLCSRIARSAGPLEHFTLVEIGPGIGGLTRALLENGAKKVLAVERDERCLPALNEISKTWPGRLEIIIDDALKLDFSRDKLGPIKLISNLPYNIGTALLLEWLKTPNQFFSLTLMFQKEVATRILAKPGNKDYGRLSVIAQWCCQGEHLFDINPTAFTPPPKVLSSLIQLIPRDTPIFPANRNSLEKITSAAFGHRRKMLRTSLKKIISHPETLLVENGIDPTARAETLSIEQFCKLSHHLSPIIDQ